ncbi:MAG: metallophosphoesterase family protein [Polyangiaceae bacterium]|nr:metallophosphoesterase family protein [Polyangiaceae bacterium]
MRFLCVSDIHGRADALEAVLGHAGVHGWDQLVACGDHLFPGPEPLRVWRRLTELKAVAVQGIGDRALATLSPDSLHPLDDTQRARLRRLREMRTELGELIVARLARLEPVVRLRLENGTHVAFVHGAPADPGEALALELEDAELEALLGDETAELIVCGGSHVPFDRDVAGRRIVNVGSVGECPTEGFAHATLLESTPFGVVVTQLDVPL